jgi:glycosyltransferase involved in cell wall biosynthesis
MNRLQQLCFEDPYPPQWIKVTATARQFSTRIAMNSTWRNLMKRLLTRFSGLRSALRSERDVVANDLLPTDQAHRSTTSKYDLVILDDAFPHPLSAFRLQEYSSYLNHFEAMKVYSTAGAFSFFADNKSFGQVLQDFENSNPSLKAKTELYDPERPLNARLVYMIFLGNAFLFLEKIEREKIPFAFTMYPGGWFQMNVPACDAGIRAICGSPYFRKVIVTQRITYNYLVERAFCKPEQIENIYGVVTPLENLDEHPKRIHYGKEKSCLDICFVAHRYSEKGRDKGYDVFIEVAKRLVSLRTNIFFHVVGGFDESVIEVADIKERIRFYGLQTAHWFEEFYRDKDIILSPNIPFQLMDGGAFDGFPTGCCTDAALHTVAIFCTDELNLNVRFTDREDIVLIPHETSQIVEIVGYYCDHPSELQSVAEKGRDKVREIYSYENQIAPRIGILTELIKKERENASL